MLRLFDIVISVMGLVTASPVMAGILVGGWWSLGSPLFFQERVGRYGRRFTMIKFRTLPIDAPQVATHLLANAPVSRYGAFLRRTKLDELPQLWNVLRGDMSIVGPRPSLSNQVELVSERTKRGVLDARPGITGLAQLTGIDMSTPELLAETDAEMLRSLDAAAYLRYTLLTVFGRGTGDRLRL